MKNAPKFVKMPKLPQLASAKSMAVLYVLCNMADNQTKQCFPSRPYLAEKTNLCERTVDLAIKELEALGVLLVDRRAKYSSNLYTVNFHSCDGSDAPTDVNEKMVQETNKNTKFKQSPQEVTAAGGGKEDDSLIEDDKEVSEEEYSEFTRHAKLCMKEVFGLEISEKETKKLSKATKNNCDILKEAFKRCKTVPNIKHPIPYLLGVTKELNPADWPKPQFPVSVWG